MIGLLIKDFTVIKKQLKITLLILIFYTVWAYVEKNTTMFSYMVTLFGLFVPITAVNFDERCEWNKYAICMPIKKSYIATSKYILGFLCIAVGAVLSLIINLLIDPNLSIDQLKNGSAMLSIGMLFLSLYLPVCFRFGADRARYFLIAIAMVPTLFFLLLSKSNMIPELSEHTIHLLITIAPFIVLVLTLISCSLSVHIVNRKEY